MTTMTLVCKHLDANIIAPLKYNFITIPTLSFPFHPSKSFSLFDLVLPAGHLITERR